VISGLLSGRLRDEATRANRSNQQLASLFPLAPIAERQQRRGGHAILMESMLAGQAGQMGCIA
jgi:two-component system sensor histidine kinase KdpD